LGRDNVVVLGCDAIEFDPFARVLTSHPFKVIDECLRAISYTGIVLNVNAHVLADGISGLALVEHEIVERHHRGLVLFEAV
jgi:hypothetical protein